MIRRVIGVAALAAAALTVVPTTAQAGTQGFRCPAGYQCNTAYYSDSAYTNLVGAKTEFCDGEVSSWGKITRYSEWTSSPCG
ncbi:DUF6289 family protein [Nonomuraea aurantiaca]|jgi:hypothetical protein|uniref:DUF6289 family protein n=1 Tax=Nonomuraea aurantiaca TaxID=2878562 RepID=UPI001CD9A209|nr:DUF6289 family protein [Nonomuraea aurantiaca]MCA2229558.1 hypothetical protein [Nonomuraea aurantiaca]